MPNALPKHSLKSRFWRNCRRLCRLWTRCREWGRVKTRYTSSSQFLRNYHRLYYKSTTSRLDTVHRLNPDATRTILKNINLDIQMDSKIAIVGPNGAGKSTLVYLLTEQVKASQGIINRHGRLRLALFSQHHVDQVDLSVSSVLFLQRKFPGRKEEDYRNVLAQFGLSGMTAVQPIGTLSGGQKSRVVFACMSLMNPHILLLDVYPSNPGTNESSRHGLNRRIGFGVTRI
jgi:ATPase subunit of ABC transporter with duplicated ATPase domains